MERFLKQKVALISLALFVLASISFASSAHSRCAGSFLNPITDVCWQCIFPIKIAGLTIVPSDLPDPPDLNTWPICTCPIPFPPFVRVGIPISFWEPARVVETVKDPFCFPTLGLGLDNLVNPGFLAGGNSSLGAGNQPDISSFQQAHWLMFPVWAMLELLTDFSCTEQGGFDVAYISEVDPLWNSDLLAFLINPEALLFANPSAQLACIADSVAANLSLPIPELFWCMGSWGSAYPMSGHIADGNYVQANAGIAARMIYKLARQMLICDTAVNICLCQPTPIWVKWNYRLQLAKPVRDITCQPIGRSGLTWSESKNPPYQGDNFAWMLFRKRGCCAF